MGLTYSWDVRFSDTDQFGIAHYPRMIDVVHKTSDIFMDEIGYPFWDLANDHNAGLPLVSMEFDFHGQIQAGDTVEIEITPEVGESSVRFEYEAKSDGEVVFSGTEIRVFAHIGSGSSSKVPDELRAAIESKEE